MSHTCTFVLALSFAFGACKKNEKKTGETPGPTPKTVIDAAAAAKPDAAATLPTMFTAKGLPSIEIGGEVSKARLEKALPGTEVVEEVETAEGEPVGTIYKVQKDKELLFVARPDDSGKLASLQFHSGFKGPKGIEPGVTKYEEARDTLGVKSCFGGAEAFAEEIRCETNEPGVSVGFADPEAKHMASPIHAKQQDKILGDRIVKWTTLTGRSDQ